MSLPPTDPQDAKDADLAAACEALQHLVKQGQCHAVETVFRQFTVLSNDRGAQLELIYLEYVLRRDTAQPTDGESLCQRFPELAEDIRMLMEVDSAVHWSRALTSVESNGHEFDNDTARG